jgi:tetratricopeptide (TPR) repeat protein
VALPAYLLANRATSLEELGRFQEAAAAFRQGLDTARKGGDLPGELFCLLYLALTSDDLHDDPAAVAYVEEASHLLSTSGLPTNAPPYKLRLFVQGRIDLSKGHIQSALSRFNAALALKLSPTLITAAQLGKAEAELQTGNPAAALQDARKALDGALTNQGGLEYSNRTGLSWLMLGRTFDELGQKNDAHHAFEMAQRNLSATVDANHPALVQTRQLLGSP